MKHIYIFSGLGADERVFKYLDFSGVKTTYIIWLLPNKNETIAQYAKRLTTQIFTKRPILIGLSFGGIIATEVAKIIETDKIVLIASAKTKFEIPFYYRIAGFLKLYKFLPVKVLKLPNIFSYWFFGIVKNEDKKLLAEILHDTNEKFLKWAIEQIVTWKNQIQHKNLIHIHGSADRIFPIYFVQCDVKIDGGGHFMTINKADVLSQKLKKIFL